MLGCFLKNNKEAYKAFKKHQLSKNSEHAKTDDKKSEKKESKLVSKKRKRSSEAHEDEPVKKRPRVSSVVSTDGPVTRQKSHDQAEESALKTNGQPLTFKRIDPTKYTNIANHFADNTFEAKEKFGQGGDSYGSWSNSKLADKHGKGFLKEKNKMKNRQSHASGRFNAAAVNSVKF